MRLTVIGNCGSGKTTFAQEVSRKLGIPHIQLDRYWFESGGHLVNAKDKEAREKVRAEVIKKITSILEKESWVSDGWYAKLQPVISAKADQIIFLDIPLWKRLFNHVKRAFFSSRHQELSKWDDFKFIFEIIERWFTHDPQIREFVSKNKEKVIILKSHREADDYITSLR